MRAKEFLDDYGVDDLNVFGRHEEHYSLDDLMEEYAKIYHESQVKKLRLSDVSGQSEQFYCVSSNALFYGKPCEKWCGDENCKALCNQ